jgi:hypothetical protein
MVAGLRAGVKEEAEAQRELRNEVPKAHQFNAPCFVRATVEAVIKTKAGVRTPAFVILESRKG